MASEAWWQTHDFSENKVNITKIAVIVLRVSQGKNIA